MTLAMVGLGVFLLAVPVLAEAQNLHGSTAPPADEPTRQGFIVGLGGGVGWIRTDLPVFRIGSTTFGGGTATSVGVASNFKIGYAPSDRVLVYYTNAAVFSDGGPYDLLALTGGGVTFLGGRRAPTWFVHGAGGVASGVALDFSGSGSGSGDLGSGYSVGGGVEFARRWFLDGTLLIMTIENRRHTVLSGTINWIFY